MKRKGRVHTNTSSKQYRKSKTFAREMRKKPTQAEDRLWQRLRRNQVQNQKFRRQQTIGDFIVDFYSSEVRLVIEVDGSIHEEQEEYDMMRQVYLESLGLHVLRFTNGEVIQSIDAVVERIGDVLLELIDDVDSDEDS